MKELIEATWDGSLIWGSTRLKKCSKRYDEYQYELQIPWGPGFKTLNMR